MPDNLYWTAVVCCVLSPRIHKAQNIPDCQNTDAEINAIELLDYFGQRDVLGFCSLLWFKHFQLLQLEYAR